MNITTTLRRMFHTVKRSTAAMFGVAPGVWNAISRMGFGGGIALAASGVMVTAEVALTISAYKRGVELLSTHVAKTAFRCEAENKADTLHPASPLIRWWARHHQMSAFEFRRTLMVHALTSGNGYAYIVRDMGMASELLLLDPSQVEPEIIGGKLWYKITGRQQPVSCSDIIHIKGMGFNGYKGLDPIRYYAREVLGLAIATQTYAAKYYENGGTPAAYLKSEIPLTDDQFNRLKGEAGPLKRAVDNPHELPILEQTDIKSVGLTAEQTQLLSARKDIILDIANLLGIPPHKLGLAISTSYGSLEEENDAFRDDALDPWLVQFEMEYRKLLTEDEQALETHCIVATRHDVSRMKAADRATYLSTLTGSAPVMTVNEARAIQGLGPVPGGDVLRTPMNMSPADAADPAAADPAAAGAEPPELDDDMELEDEETDDAEESAMRSHQLQALEDVFQRMTKRLATASSKVKRADQLAEFRSALERHTPVIQSAFAPIVGLCGGKNAGEIAEMLVNEYRSRLDALEVNDTLPAAVAELGETFVAKSSVFAEDALNTLHKQTA